MKKKKKEEKRKKKKTKKKKKEKRKLPNIFIKMKCYYNFISMGKKTSLKKRRDVMSLCK